jgi:hypothetical protein
MSIMYISTFISVNLIKVHVPRYTRTRSLTHVPKVPNAHSQTSLCLLVILSAVVMDYIRGKDAEKSRKETSMGF